LKKRVQGSARGKKSAAHEKARDLRGLCGVVFDGVRAAINS